MIETNSVKKKEELDHDGSLSRAHYYTQRPSFGRMTEYWGISDCT